MRLFFLCCLIIFLSACASSNVQRNAANSVDTTYQASSDFMSHFRDSRIQDSYQNSSQMTKGMVVGGATGAAVGGLTSGVGVLPGLAEGAIFGGAIGAYIDANTSLVDKLENRRVKVIVLGDQVMIVLPSDQIFEGISPRIRYTARSTLDLVLKLINGYTTMSVKIAGYTTAAGPSRINQIVSQEQAESIEKYFWRKGINTRVVYAVGMGDMRPVESVCAEWNLGENYRIEITMEKLPT